MRPASAAMAIARDAEAVAPLAAVPAVKGVSVRFDDAARGVVALAREWRQLAVDAAEPNPFAEHWFVAASIRHLARSQVKLAEVREDGALIGLLPLVVGPRHGRLPVSTVQNWRHFHLFVGSPLVRAGSERVFWSSLIEALDRSDWAPSFLHLRDMPEGGVLHSGLAAAAASLGRSAPIVYREQRAFLQSALSPTEYYEEAVRKKKRKELSRLQNRLAEIGPVSTRLFEESDDLAAWCDRFLEMERAGWKGAAGSALACDPATEGFFRDAVAGAASAGRLQFIRMDVDERPVAMLVNFLTPPGSFSFKTAFDEGFARFSPGVLLQIENLAILDNPEIAWMDSCAAEQHPMIDSLWRQRRSIVRLSVPLKGVRRRSTYAFVRALERASAARRRLTGASA